MARTLLLLPCSQPPPVTILPVPNDAPSPGSMARPLLTPSPVRGRGALLVMANAKKSLGCTKQGTRRCVWGGGAAHAIFPATRGFIVGTSCTNGLLDAACKSGATGSSQR